MGVATALLRTAARAASAASLAASAACGGGPSGPESPPTLAGSYAGRVNYRSALPTDACYARFLASLGPTGHDYSVQLDAQQVEERVSGTLRGTQIQTACQFAGQVMPGGALNWRQTSCSEPCTTFRDGPCDAIRVCVVDHAFTGRFASGVSGTHTVAWDTFDAVTGVPRGRIDIAGSLEVR